MKKGLRFWLQHVFALFIHVERQPDLLLLLLARLTAVQPRRLKTHKAVKAQKAESKCPQRLWFQLGSDFVTFGLTHVRFLAFSVLIVNSTYL